MKFLFPAAFAVNMFAVTCMMIVLGLSGQSDSAADFGIVHGATVALLYSFSANARNIVLSANSGISTGTILGARLLLLLPLGTLSLLLSTHIADVSALLALALVLRRCAEWLAEVHVSKMEVLGESRLAMRFLVIQIALFPITAVCLIADSPLALPVLFAWASSPVWLSTVFVLRETRIAEVLRGGWLQLLPHLGSTAVIGISVYVFRLLILLLVGRTVAGDLYTAFAIGSLLGAIYGHAIGPTLALHEARTGSSAAPLWIKIPLVLVAMSGTGIYLVAELEPQWLELTGKTGFFWAATGASLIGSVIMIIAWRIRLRMLQHHANGDVFGPDVLINILIVASVPYVFFLAGADALASLFLLSATLSLVFYYSAEKSAVFWDNRDDHLETLVKSLIAALLLLPLFFQLDGSIFRETAYIYETGGNLTRLPIPVSVIACYGGIILLGRYATANVSLITLFATFSLMLVSSSMHAYNEGGQEKAKLILLTQFVLPMFALVLGQIYREYWVGTPVLARTFLWLLGILVPVQLIATWVQGEVVLVPSLYLFSIYQNVQYVTTIFVTIYLLILYSLWHKPGYRPVLFTLGTIMAIYAASSVSTLAMIILVTGIIGLAAHAAFRNTDARILATLALLVTVLGASYFTLASGNTAFANKYNKLAESVLIKDVVMPGNVAARLNYWTFYSSSIFTDAYTAALGHAAPPDRRQYPSAHNYYLDFAYNFGIVALLPLLALIGVTFAGIWKMRRKIVESPPLLGLTLAAMFLVLGDNFLKVGMRQPYPGILTFFLWGILLSHLLPPARSSPGKDAP